MNGEKSPAGSVKRARQRAAAGLPPEQRPDIPPPPAIPSNSSKQSPRKTPSPIDRIQYPQYPMQTMRHTPSPPRYPTPSRLKRGSPSPPLQQDISPILQPHAFEGLPPHRAPQLTRSPPITQGSEFQDGQSASEQSQNPSNQAPSSVNYWEDNYSPSAGFEGYSSGSRPSTTATGSSTASIPIFPPIPSVSSVPPVPPMPAYQAPPRRNLGPPPSARRGYSSYYSQSSIVIPPIPEERSDVASRSSFASSRVPESWGDGPVGFYLDQGIDEEYEEQTDGGSSGRQSRAGDHDEQSVLVRKASRGKPLRPFMEEVESEDETDLARVRNRNVEEPGWQTSPDERFRPGFAVGTDPIGRHNFRKDSRLYSGYESDVAFLDSPGSSSPTGTRTPQTAARLPYSRSPSNPGSPADPRIHEILGNLEKGGALSSSSGGTTPARTVSISMSEKGIKRPPPLKLASSAKDGPGRASQSSLPELIRRATRLATNLDRGNTASRVGMLEVLNAKDQERQRKGSQNGSLSDIIAAFPSPSPTPGTPTRPPNWGAASPHGKSNLSRSQTVNYGPSRRYARHRVRRWCGLPIWAFLLLLIILLLLIAAAIVIPITLIVVPKENKNNAGASLASCQKASPCGNGGTSFVVNKQCRCICANSFTGSTCNTAPDSACATTNLNDTSITYQSATLGNSIPRIISGATPNYTIPLSGTLIASLFSYNNVSCASENALVTLNQHSQKYRRGILDHQPDQLSDPSSEDSPHLHSPLDLLRRVIPSRSKSTPPTRIHPRASAQTSNNIIFAAPSSAAGSGAAAPPGSGTSSTGTGQTTSPETIAVTTTIIDFARTAVLFIFQETASLQTATTALDKLQALLDGGVGAKFDAAQTSAGGNITVDLTALTVGFGNGTLFGGKVGQR